MYTILIPIDADEERAMSAAQTLANLPVDPDEVDIILTHVLEGEERRAPKELQTPDRVVTVRKVKANLEETGFNVEVREARSPPVEGILDLADEEGADHIVMAARKRTPAGKALFGSVTQSVIIESDLPVTVAGTRFD